MHLPDANTFWIIVASLLGASLTAGLTWWFKVKPERDRERAAERKRTRDMQDVVLGEPPEYDDGGFLTHKAVPGLLHATRENSKAIAKTEETLSTLVEAFANQRALQADVTDLKSRVDVHDDSIAVLLAGHIADQYNRADQGAIKVAADVIDVDSDRSSTSKETP